jgi:hypothetical protein
MLDGARLPHLAALEPLVGLVAVALGAAACGDGEADAGDVQAALAGRTTALCPELTGVEAMAWDYYNGVPITDPVLPPPVPPFGGTFSHTDFPLLGFTFAPGWTPFEIRSPGVTGVDLLRDDQAAIWRYVAVTTGGALDAAQIRATEAQQAANFFGGPPLQPVCRNQGQFEAAPGTGIVTRFDNAFAESDERGLLVTVAVTTVPGVGSSSAYVRVLSAPADEFAARLYDRFMATDWQLLVDDPDRRDRDRDGWIDVFDAFPDDPNRH